MQELLFDKIINNYYLIKSIFTLFDNKDKDKKKIIS